MNVSSMSAATLAIRYQPSQPTPKTGGEVAQKVAATAALAEVSALPTGFMRGKGAAPVETQPINVSALSGLVKIARMAG